MNLACGPVNASFFCLYDLQEIINEWDEQERIAQEKAEQENSLYRYRSRSCRTALSEEEEEELELRKFFPLHEKVVGFALWLYLAFIVSAVMALFS